MGREGPNRISKDKSDEGLDLVGGRSVHPDRTGAGNLITLAPDEYSTLYAVKKSLVLPVSRPLERWNLCTWVHESSVGAEDRTGGQNDLVDLPIAKPLSDQHPLVSGRPVSR